MPARLTIDRQAFEMPTFEVSVTVLGSVARAVVETVPSRGTDGDVANETDGTVANGFSDVEDFAVRMVLILVGTRVRGIRDGIELHDWVDILETSLTTEPLVNSIISM